MPRPSRPAKLPPSVYWRRRAVVVTLALMLFVGIGKMLSHSTQANDRVQPAAALASPTLTVTSDPVASSSAGKPRKHRHHRTSAVPTPTPVLATPSGTCADGDVVVTPSVDQAVAGGTVTITLNLQTIANPACTWQVSADSLAVRITSGSDFIWSTQQCPAVIAPQAVVVRQSVQTQISLSWNGKRSDPACDQYTQWALPGYYHVAAAALGGNRQDVQFKLARPTPQTVYVTKTAKPTRHHHKGAASGH